MSDRTRIVTEEEVGKALPASFLAKISPEPNSGCWLWAASWNTTGYGNFWFGGRCHTAHRFIYERLFGQQPNLEIDHTCRLPCCVNPAHLEAVTVAENNRRRVGLGRGNGKKTHCAKGHQLSGSNLEILTLHDGSRRRRCITCRKFNQKTYLARKKSNDGPDRYKRGR